MAYADEVLADSPLVFLQLGDDSGTTAVDFSGNGRDGTYVNSPTLNQPGIPGAPDGSVQLDGSNDHVSIPANSVYYPSSSVSITVECWYKGTDTGANSAAGSVGPKAFVAANDASNAKRFVVGLDADGKVRCYTDDQYVLTGPSTTVVNDDEWHHIVLTITASSYDTELYIDGVLEVTSTATNDAGQGSPNIVIGRNVRQATNGYVAGRIDEVAIYGTKLSGARIAAHYLAGISPTGSASGTLTIAATATGSAPSSGTASGSLTIAASASGSVVSVDGSASATLEIVGSVDGSPVLSGSASGTLEIVGSASGSGPPSGYASGILEIVGSATGLSPPPYFGTLDGLCNIVVEGNLVLNGIPMKTRAWVCADLTPLWQSEAIRGTDRLFPLAPGVRGLARRRAPTVYSLDFRITGFASVQGNPTIGSGNGPEEFERLESNLDFLRQNVIDPRTSPNPDGTVPGVLTMPSGEIRTADVHVLGFTVNRRVSHILQGVLDISIPTGGFV